MPQRYLIVGPAWVGDMVMAQSLFMTLRDQYPQASIDVLAPPWSLPLLARMPEVREGIELPFGHGDLALGRRRRLGHSLREREYDQAIVLPRSWKSALVPFHARAARRTGYRGEARYGLLNDIRVLDEALLSMTVQRFVALGRDAGETHAPPVPEPRLTVDEENLARLETRHTLDRRRGVVAMMPGAEFGPAKCWPLEYFGKIARELAAAGMSVWVLGSEKDRDAGRRIVETSDGGAISLCGVTRLEDAVDLLSVAQRVITNDSGLMHIAAAVGCHVDAIYGSSNPRYTPPLTQSRTIHTLALDCSPCMQRECPLGHYKCLRDLHPDQVLGDAGTPRQ
jgi:heptosyltransferase-2